MRILISADTEGATGVACPGDVLPGTPGRKQCLKAVTTLASAAMEEQYG